LQMGLGVLSYLTRPASDQVSLKEAQRAQHGILFRNGDLYRGVKPSKDTEWGGAINLHAPENVLIRPGPEWKKVQLGLRVDIPHGYYATVKPRSTVSICLPAVEILAFDVDSDFSGELSLLIRSKETVVFPMGYKIAEMRIIPCLLPKLYIRVNNEGDRPEGETTPDDFIEKIKPIYNVRRGRRSSVNGLPCLKKPTALAIEMAKDTKLEQLTVQALRGRKATQKTEVKVMPRDEGPDLYKLARTLEEAEPYFYRVCTAIPEINYQCELKNCVGGDCKGLAEERRGEKRRSDRLLEKRRKIIKSTK